MKIELLKSIFPLSFNQQRLFLGVLFFSIIGINVYFITSNIAQLQNQITIEEYLNHQTTNLNEITSLFEQRFSGNSKWKIQFDSAVHRFTSSPIPQYEAVKGMGQDKNLPNLYTSVSKGFQDIDKILQVISSQKVMAKENQDVLQSQLNKEISGFKNALMELRNSHLYDTQNFSKTTKQVLIYSGVLFVLLVLFYNVVVVRSLETKKEAISDELISMQSELKGEHRKSEEIVKKAKETETLLKVKTAQVKKLQESLELAIAYSTKTQQDKNLIYFNIASDLSNYCKVLNLQKKILENQTSLGVNENWMVLTNTISQIHSLAGDYFKQAKNHVLHKDNQEIYLAPFLSELILSLGHDNSVSFEQVADLPSIKTNTELLKRVLQPYMDLISHKTPKGVVSYSARVDGIYCEFKFFGLDMEFESALSSTFKKDLSDYTFDEFKIHMAEKVLMERGGKAWVQLDSGKAVFTIYWPL
jgi:hypothetical protein